jgi:muramidase (phage lysozyme)
MSRVYKPLLDLIGKAEGTDPPRGRGYNETLSYGAFTGGPVNLVGMTLAEIDQLQTQMLRHPRNTWNSSAIGRYQIVRTTLRRIRSQLGLSGSELYNEPMQNRLALFLLGSRGIDDYLDGNLTEDRMLLELAREWASFPTPQGRGYYGNQSRTPITPDDVRKVLHEVRALHNAEPEHPKAETDSPDTPTSEHWLIRILRLLFGGK